MFKNLQIYRLPTNWLMGIIALEEMLSRGKFVKCPSNQPVSRGWVSPRNNGPLVYSLAGQWLISLKSENRLLPSSVINEEVKERSSVMQEQQGYAPGRKQLKELKERVIEELMPRAFTKSSITNAWIDPINGYLAIDAGSPSKAEEVIEHLRHCLDEFPLSMLHTNISPSAAMADWLAGGESPAGFTIDRDCELKSVGEEKAAVRYVRHALDGDEIEHEVKAHLSSGKLPTRLALTWDDRISFVLTEKMEVKRVSMLDIIECEKSENADDQFDSDFALMTGELGRFIPQLIEALGGEVKE
jgi:recombination associated protein RdgC